MTYTYTINGWQFKTQKSLQEAIRKILHAYPLEQELNPNDFSFMLGVLDMHPDSEIKIGCGVATIFVRQNAIFRQNREFWVRRLDGSETDFSFNECLKPRTPLKKFTVACRNAVRKDMNLFRNRNLTEDSVCPFTGQRLTLNNVHVDHMPPETFDKIVKDFIQLFSIDPKSIPLTGVKDREVGDNFVDNNLVESFRQFHNEKAQLRLVSARANLSDIRRGMSLGTAQE